MRLKYGDYWHPFSEADVTHNKVAIYGAQGYRIGYKETWHITGLLQAADQAALVVAQNALDAAYADDGSSLILYQNDGSTVARQLNSDASTSGVKIVEGPSYPESGKGSNEYGLYHTYLIIAEAEFTGDDAGAELPEDLLAFTETLSIFGTGGHQFVCVPILNGTWPVQRLRQATSVRATQQGQAIGRSGYPPLPAPIFSGWEHVELREDSKTSPKRTGPAGRPKFAEYARSWAYQFESPTALAGNPTQKG